jgi:hypothetical protein
LHPGFFSRIGYFSRSNPIQDWSQDAPVYSSSIPPFAPLLLNLGEKENLVGAVGNVGKSRGFIARLFQAAVGIRAFCGFPRTRHFPSGLEPIIGYPQIPLKTQQFQAG